MLNRSAVRDGANHGVVLEGERGSQLGEVDERNAVAEAGAEGDDLRHALLVEDGDTSPLSGLHGDLHAAPRIGPDGAEELLVVGNPVELLGERGLNRDALPPSLDVNPA